MARYARIMTAPRCRPSGDGPCRLVRPRPRGARTRMDHRSLPPSSRRSRRRCTSSRRRPGARRSRRRTFRCRPSAPRSRDLCAELLEGRGFFMLRGLPVDATSREEQAIAYLGIGSYFGRPRSQNAKGHLLGHVKDLGLDIARPERPLLPDQPAARVPHRLGRHGRPPVPEDRRRRAARASSSAR